MGNQEIPGFASRTSQLYGLTQIASLLWALFYFSGRIKGLTHDFTYYLYNLGQIIEHLVPRSPYLQSRDNKRTHLRVVVAVCLDIAC